MKIIVKAFGIISEIIGIKDLELKNVKDTNTMTNILNEKYPKLGQYYYILSVNNKLINDYCTLSNNDEVALIPPFAGG